MDISHPLWEQYATRFEALAQQAQKVDKPEPALDNCKIFLCLYGENGVAEEEELAMLQQLDTLSRPSLGTSADSSNPHPETFTERNGLFKLEVETPYWQDTVLFVP